MSSMRVKGTWMVVDQTYSGPTRADSYAVYSDDTMFPEEADWSAPATESYANEAPSSRSVTWTPTPRYRGAAKRHRYRAPKSAGSSGSWCNRWPREGQPRGHTSKDVLRRRRRERERCRVRRAMERRCQPRTTSWEHLPVVIPPTRWYQVVGSMQCSHCKAQGRHQITSWMCQCCQVALCLKPYRNCYTEWHGA
ncbi:uncharacterized protein LOC110369309 isoform X2 [Fundulus heteroclitus]|uniref:uncharacterized protein LOC110369309 isoform X2 n=1 Tax=Fundulus heteroclitus TaxID=8078 RepID=UPI00165A3F63|nr:uncharacterized protein LOC110369309 isoform X2 [Fundulus heteroclitus]